VFCLGSRAFFFPLSDNNQAELKKALPLGKRFDEELPLRRRLGGSGDVAGNCSTSVRSKLKETRERDSHLRDHEVDRS
jgi:hypothetical protein